MNIVRADILSNLPVESKVVLAHGCNCFHTMGAGIAFYLAEKYPIIFSVDRATKKGDKEKLGSFSSVPITDTLTIYNCYTQYHPGADATLSAIEASLTAMVAAEGSSVEYRLPKIGCGIGGLQWCDVKKIYDKLFFDKSLTVYYI